ncbi:MAG: threonylcarbamoyl-AMP synthase [Anaerolineae bacterium]|nr:threonylcarbamoyl-AMP synthase [Anaerolineae bacterium]
MTDWLPIDDPAAPARAAEVIRAGGVVIFPADTVYGIAADVWQPKAVAALYAVKQRPPDKAIPVLLADPEHIDLVASDVPSMARRLASAFWPGPLTIAVPKNSHLPEIVSALPTVGVRIPDHDGTRAVIRACGGALAVTSANLSGASNPLTAGEASSLGEGIALVLDGGRCAGGQPSTVVDVSGGSLRIVRPGPIGEDVLRSIIDD